MKTGFILALAFLCAGAPLGNSWAAENNETADLTPAKQTEAEDEGHSFGHKLLFYIPNRLFDIVDIVRLKVQVGPGLTAAARVTEVADVWVGGHTAAWLGLPGSRRKPTIPLPVGIDSKAGVKVSLIDLTAQANKEPPYPWDEVGADVHLLFVGVGGGVSVVQAADALLGFLFIDISGDDL